MKVRVRVRVRVDDEGWRIEGMEALSRSHDPSTVDQKAEQRSSRGKGKIPTSPQRLQSDAGGFREMTSVRKIPALFLATVYGITRVLFLLIYSVL